LGKIAVGGEGLFSMGGEGGLEEKQSALRKGDLNRKKAPAGGLSEVRETACKPRGKRNSGEYSIIA